MAIYGLALLSLCLVIGSIIGKLLGLLLGIDANVGGVGIAMLLLIVSAEKLRKAGHMSDPTRSGIVFWSSVYIPIVVAMAAGQNVRAAIGGGPAAIMAGIGAVVVGFALVPAVCRIGQKVEAPSEGDVEGSDQE